MKTKAVMLRYKFRPYGKNFLTSTWDSDEESLVSASEEQALSLAFLKTKGTDYRLFNDAYDEPVADGFAGHARFQAQLLECEDPATLEPVDFFKHFFPMSYISSVVIPATNVELEPPLVLNEFLLYLGIRIASTLFNVDKVQDLWTIESQSLKPAANFGQFGMTYRRFQSISSHMKLVDGPEDSQDPLHDVRGFIKAYNNNMTSHFRPGWAICLDESMSKWTNRYSMPNWTYCPRKPTPMGQMFHDMADAESHIVFVFACYRGKCI